MPSLNSPIQQHLGRRKSSLQLFSKYKRSLFYRPQRESRSSTIVHQRPYRPCLSRHLSHRPIILPKSPSIITIPQLRSIHIPPLLLPPLIFAFLFLSLWAWKCLMLILFQNRIIYMPSMPPFSRSEKIADYTSSFRDLWWREERVRSADGVEVALVVGDFVAGEGKDVVILYFQG